MRACSDFNRESSTARSRRSYSCFGVTRFWHSAPTRYLRTHGWRRYMLEAISLFHRSPPEFSAQVTSLYRIADGWLGNANSALPPRGQAAVCTVTQSTQPRYKLAATHVADVPRSSSTCKRRKGPAPGHVALNCHELSLSQVTARQVTPRDKQSSAHSLPHTSFRALVPAVLAQALQRFNTMVTEETERLRTVGAA
jgi:hypothetical protein